MTSSATVATHYALPPAYAELLIRNQGSESLWSDSRRFPRRNTRGQCLLVPDSTYANCGHNSASQDVLLCDLSRGGVRLLHGGELFPGETCQLTFSSGTSLRLKVVWCRCLERGIYSSGCLFEGA